MSLGKQSKPGRQSMAKETSVLEWAGVGRSRTLVLFVMLAMVLFSGLSVVHTTHQNRFSFNELQELRQQANSLEVEWGQLLIEQSTFGVEGRIEQKAVEQLQMQVPAISSIVMVSHDQ